MPRLPDEERVAREAAYQQRLTRKALRDARARTDLTVFDVAQLLDWPLSKILRIEQGCHPVDTIDQDQLMELYR